MVGRVPIVPITPLKYPENALLDFSGINNALTDVRKANEFDQRHALDRDRFQAQDRRETERLGLERTRVGIAQRTQQQGDEERQATILGNIAETINGIQDDGARRTAWGRLVGSHPSMAQTLRKYGQDPNDHVNGPGFIIAQTRDPLQRRVREAYINQAAGGRQPGQGEPQPEYRINEEGELERAPSTVGPGRFGITTPAAQPGPAAFRVPNGPAIAGPQQDVVPAQSATSDPSGVPGIMLNRPLATDRYSSEGGQRETDAQQLWPRIQAQDQTLTTPEINRAWSSIWGRQPKAGHIYNLRGQEIPNTPPGGGDRGTRDAIKGAIDQARQNVADAREVIGGTSWVGRQASHLTNTGAFARVQPHLEIAARSIMHGLSGAQVNIPETQSYLNAFMPQPGETMNTINGKLDHMDGILTRIQMRQGGQFSEEDLLDIRNRMRATIGLRALSMEQHLGTGRAGGRPPPPPPAPGQQPRTDRPRTDRTQRLYDKYGLQ